MTSEWSITLRVALPGHNLPVLTEAQEAVIRSRLTRELSDVIDDLASAETGRSDGPADPYLDVLKAAEREALRCDDNDSYAVLDRLIQTRLKHCPERELT